MNVACGLKAHSGWAALVVLGAHERNVEVVDRRRIELVEPADAAWAKQPYHAAEGLPPAQARDVVKRGIDAARRMAVREMRAIVQRTRDGGQTLRAAAVLVAEPMPSWSVDEILAVHFRMHKAEGVLFRDVLARAADRCGIELVALPEKWLAQHAAAALASPMSSVAKRIAALGKSVGAPWGKDQKEAALAALIALQGR